MKDSIKALREKHNYSQSYLATYLQVSRQMYIKYESGDVEPPVKIVVALAKLYSVSYSQIIDDEFSPNKEKVSYKIQQDTESYIGRCGRREAQAFAQLLPQGIYLQADKKAVTIGCWQGTR